MDEKLITALTELATKLGVTTEYLWGVLLKQAPISGGIDIMVMCAWVSAIYMWAKYVQRKTERPAVTTDCQYPHAEWNDEMGVFLAWGSVGLAAILAATIIGCNLSISIAAFVNPEYWALKQIIK